MAEGHPTQLKAALRAFGELGPAWVASIASVIAVVGGLIVGHVTASSTIVAQPTVTIIKTIQAESSASTATPTATTSSTGSSNFAPSSSAKTNGTQLGSYSIDFSAQYSVPLDPAQPTQAQFTNNSSSGDLYYGGAGYATARSSEQLVSLPNGTTPTYQACSTDTVFTTFVDDTAGASFCVIETNGDLAGVYVSSDQSGYALLQVTVWQHTSP